MDFTLIARAGMTQREFAALSNVTRTTVNHWVTGKMSPHRYISKRVEGVTAAIALALQEGKLPLRTPVQSPDRITELRALLGIPESAE